MGDTYDNYEPKSKMASRFLTEKELQKLEELKAKMDAAETSKLTATSEVPSFKTHDISDEEWREYEWQWGGEKFKYRIVNPKQLVVGKSTHRVVDAEGIVHCVPNIGYMGCVLRWKGPISF